ncbi:selenoprotein M-like [Cimex lectularius]|uniref:Selenoprotein M n=1 Tax=Cimex lectularius TaxID=79782 RepID=A0A8I6RDI9_CIMLE|nr:selenoprotein M-like [Cimex lectularius]
MIHFIKLGTLFACVVLVLSTYDSEITEAVAKAEIQSCSGCSLRNLPDVKSFIFDDVPLYERVVFKNTPRAPPELVLFTEEYKELKRIPLRELTRTQCNELLQDWGFTKKLKNEL